MPGGRHGDESPAERAHRLHDRPGNHDTAAVCPGGSACDPARTKTLVRDNSTFNQYFTGGSFGAVTERFEAGKVDNVLAEYTAGGLRWGVLSLELWPRTAVVDWPAGWSPRIRGRTSSW